MRRNLILFLCLLLSFGFLAGCGNDVANDEVANEAQNSKLVVGATAKPHAEILEVVKPLLANEGIDLVIKEFTDYVLINPALQEGQVDANFFQHTPFLDEYNDKNKSDLKVVIQVHNEPMGIYSKSITDFQDLPDGATVGIPNDATNGGRALLVVEQAGLIKIKDGVGVNATDRDIVENPQKLIFQMMDAPMLPRALEDLPMCVINSNFALEADLNPVSDSIFMEPSDSPFANVLVVKSGDETKEDIQKLAKALQSEEVKVFLEETYKGACVPSF
ncbi:MAG TPA: MetQ/NlpA family ABC transporter substrate-binding protein [Syntrophomonadaceae bacterium]|nr:MetQ/NlpA family ABC transporter substrate-binding protein [Syntrophomonadaceae bacterium]